MPPKNFRGTTGFCRNKICDVWGFQIRFMPLIPSTGQPKFPNFILSEEEDGKFDIQMFCEVFHIHPINCSCEKTPLVCRANILQQYSQVSSLFVYNIIEKRSEPKKQSQKRSIIILTLIQLGKCWWVYKKIWNILLSF